MLSCTFAGLFVYVEGGGGGVGGDGPYVTALKLGGVGMLAPGLLRSWPPEKEEKEMSQEEEKEEEEEEQEDEEDKEVTSVSGGTFWSWRGSLGGLR